MKGSVCSNCRAICSDIGPVQYLLTSNTSQKEYSGVLPVRHFLERGNEHEISALEACWLVFDR